MVPLIKIGAVATRAHNRRHGYAFEPLKAGPAPARRSSRVWRAWGLSALSASALPPLARQRASVANRKSPCRTVFPPFFAVFGRLFGEHESKAVDESITWPFRRFSSPFKNGENGGNGAASNRRRESTGIHSALKHLERLLALRRREGSIEFSQDLRRQLDLDGGEIFFHALARR
jgi:hypothetical protein